jgi:dethiobiotin synthase (EC 6.3.3.3)
LQLQQSPEEITPIFLSAPLAPPISAEKEKGQIDLSYIWHKYQQLVSEYDLVLVETLGGLGSPLTYEYLVADLARDWQVPTVLVGAVRLGGIAQIVANVALARSLHIPLKGIVLNCISPESRESLADLTPPALIENLTNVPVWGILPHISDIYSTQQLSQSAQALDRLLPE